MPKERPRPDWGRGLVSFWPVVAPQSGVPTGHSCRLVPATEKYPCLTTTVAFSTVQNEESDSALYCNGSHSDPWEA